MGLLTIAVFFVMMFGLGALALIPVRKPRLSLALISMSLGFGISFFIILALLFNLLRIPIDWKIFTVIGFVGCAFFIYRYKSDFKISFKSEKAFFHLGAVLITLGMLFIYLQGAFSYPHLENDDSWAHAMSISYVREQKTLLEPDYTYDKLFDVGAYQYVDPYPPSYDALMAVLVQAEGRLNWTLKFFNAVIVSLSYLFFYFFAIHFLGSVRKGFLATVVLAAIPAYMTHFIWAIAISLPLFFVALFALEKMSKDHSWFVPAALSVAAGLIVSPTHSVYFALFIAVYLIGKLICERNIHLKIWASCIVGGLLTVVLWWIPMLLRYKSIGVIASRLGFQTLTGTGDRPYSLADFVFTKNQNLIQAPTGLGVAVFILALLSLFLLFRNAKQLLNKEYEWKLITLGWLILTIYAVNSANLPLRLSAFRTWMLLAIPVAILAASAWEWLMEAKRNVFWLSVIGSALILIVYNQYASSVNQNAGYSALPSLDLLLSVILIPIIFGVGYILPNILKGAGISAKRVPLIIFLVVAVLLITTSFTAKYSINTTQWWAGGSFFYGNNYNQKDYEGYMSLRELPKNSRIFSLTYRHAANILGMDGYTCLYCKEDIEMRPKTGNVSTSELYDWLRSRKYDYVILDTDYAFVNGPEKARQRVDEMQSSGKFRVEKANENFVLFRVL